MPEPRTLGRVDWMPHNKVWRVIWYKGAADIPAGDYPTKKEAEDALRELVARGNPTPVTPEVTRISPTYENLAEGQILVDQAGDKWLVTGIKKQGVPGRWAYTIKGETIDLTRTRPLGEIERYYKMEQPAIPKAKAIEIETIDLSRGRMIEIPLDAEGKAIPRESEGGNPGDKDQIICQRCNKRPAEHQIAGWLPICKVCNDEIFQLPQAEMLKEMKRLWDEFSNGNPGNPYKMLGGNPMKNDPRTEKELANKKSMEEASRLYRPPLLELGSLEEKAGGLLPMSPENGPPLPRVFDIKWPWKK